MAKIDLRVDWCSYEAAKYACEHWHYSKSVPVPPLVKVGAWEKDRFVGAVIFSRGATPNLLNPFGLKQTEGCELTRIALNRHESQVSRIVRVAIAFLKRTSPSLRIVVSFADPAEGHNGAIYQAGNWIYTGESSKSIEYIDSNGKRVHGRMVKKKGWTIVHGKRRVALTPIQCTAITKPKKHRYVMPLDNEMRARVLPLAKPYPKRPKQAMAGDHSAQRRCDTDPDAPIQPAAAERP